MPTMVCVGGPADGKRTLVESFPRAWFYARFGLEKCSESTTAMMYRDLYRPVSVQGLPDDIGVYAHESISAATCMLMLVAGYRQPRYKEVVA